MEERPEKQKIKTAPKYDAKNTTKSCRDARSVRSTSRCPIHQESCEHYPRIRTLASCFALKERTRLERQHLQHLPTRQEEDAQKRVSGHCEQRSSIRINAAVLFFFFLNPLIYASNNCSYNNSHHVVSTVPSPV